MWILEDFPLPVFPAKRAAQGGLIAAVGLAAALGYLATGQAEAHAAIAAAGTELTRLLRGMALIKALIAAVVLTAVFWRLQFPATQLRAGVYIGACAAMAAGPFLVWDMAHIIAGAVLLHAGLMTAVLLGWRDKTVAASLTFRLPAKMPAYAASRASTSSGAIRTSAS
jgi:hypothetical protein